MTVAIVVSFGYLSAGNGMPNGKLPRLETGR
jgi:hypothetical protein